jgi:hypothetical protein
MESPLNCTSADLEKEVIARFQLLTGNFLGNSRIFREPWGNSTVLCIDFESFPYLFPLTREQTHVLRLAMRQLGLANSVIFRSNNKVLGWKKLEC